MLILPETITEQQMYKLLIGGVAPRPIAWVSTLSLSGIANLAPFSFFTVASANPPVMCFNPMYTDLAAEKDTLVNIRDQKEFVINSVSFADLEKMSQTCHNLPSGEDEFDYAMIERAPSDLVKPHRVVNAVVSFECRLNRIIDLGDKPLSGHLVLGDVVAVHVKDEALDNFRVDSDVLDAIGRMSGDEYSLTRERVKLKRF